MKSEIPNITGVAHYAGAWAIDGYNAYAYGTIPSGAFAIHIGANHYVGVHSADTDAASGYDFYASRCSDRYGNYTEVNPLYSSALMLIRY